MGVRRDDWSDVLERAGRFSEQGDRSAAVAHAHGLLERLDEADGAESMLSLAALLVRLGLHDAASHVRSAYEARVMPETASFAVPPPGVFDAPSELLRAELLMEERPPKWNDARQVLENLIQAGHGGEKVNRLFARALFGAGDVEGAIAALERGEPSQETWGVSLSPVVAMALCPPASSFPFSYMTSAGDPAAEVQQIAVLASGLATTGDRGYACQLEQLASPGSGLSPHSRSQIRYPILYRFYSSQGLHQTALKCLEAATKTPGVATDVLIDIAWELGNLVIMTSLDQETFTVRPPDVLPEEKRALLADVAEAMVGVAGLLDDCVEPEVSVPFFARLSRLLELQGDGEGAKRAAERLEQALSARGRRPPSLAWFADHWFPLAEIKALPNGSSLQDEARAIERAEVEGHFHDDRRVAALAAALAGKLEKRHVEEVGRIAQLSGSFSDRMWAAELAQAIDDHERAGAEYASVLSSFGFQWDALRSLVGLSHGSILRAGEQGIAAFSPEGLRQARDWAYRALADDPGDAGSLRCAAELELLLGDRERAESLRRRAEALASAAPVRGDAPRVGRIWAAAAYRLTSGVRIGVIHELECHRERLPADREFGLVDSDIQGTIQDDFRQTVKEAFQAADEYARCRTWCSQAAGRHRRYRYRLVVPLDRFPSGGRSAGITLTVLFLSSFLDLPIPQDIAMTGEIRNHGHGNVLVKVIGDEAYKGRGMADKGLRFLVLPRDNEPFLPLDYDFERDKIRYVAILDDVFELRDAAGELIFPRRSPNASGEGS